MSAFFVILLIICVVSMLTEDIADVLRELWGLYSYLFDVLWIALCTILKALWFVLRHLGRFLAYGARLLGRGTSLGFTFLFYLIAECLRREPKEFEADGSDDEDESALKDAALTLLGLPATFTRAALDAAYKKAIRKAHPDAGGSLQQAQAVNAARDLLSRAARSS